MNEVEYGARARLFHYSVIKGIVVNCNGKINKADVWYLAFHIAGHPIFDQLYAKC